MQKNIYTVSLKTEFFEEDGVIVGIAPEINVSSFGETLQEAQASLQEAIECFLESCMEMGTIDDVLEESGFIQVEQSVWSPRERIKQVQEQIKVASTFSHA